MTPHEAARALLGLADRVERLKPLNHDPERYFLDRGEAVAEMRKLAQELAPGRVGERKAPDSFFSPGSIEHKGRRVPVERRGARRTPDALSEARKVFR